MTFQASSSGTYYLDSETYIDASQPSRHGLFGFLDFSPAQVIFFTLAVPNSAEFISYPTSIDYIEDIELMEPIDIVIHKDEDSYLATTDILSLYGIGANVAEAIDMLKNEILTLKEDLNEETELNNSWSEIRDYLNRIVSV